MIKGDDQIKLWVYRVALVSALAGAIYYFIIVIYITLSRIRYPFSLEWTEGASLIQVQRILNGKLLYDQPTYEYIALNYPPLYHYASALFARVLGPGFFPLRLVSFMSSVGCAAAIYLICRKERAEIPAATMASGLFAAAYRLGGAWFDIARVDMLALFFLLLSIYLLCFRSALACVMAGMTIALACLTKQTYIICFIFLGLGLSLFEPKKGLFFIVASALSFGAISFHLDRIFSGWYTFFVFTISIGRGDTIALTPSMMLESIRDFWGNKVILPFIVVVLFIMAYGFMQRKQDENLKTLIFYMSWSIGLVGLSWASMVHFGSYDNNLIPAYAALSILFGLSVEKLCFNQNIGLAYRGVLLFACALQFFMLRFPIDAQIPTMQDLLAGKALVEEIQKQAGDVYIPFHPELELIAGKPTFADWNAMYLLDGGYGGGDPKEAQRVKVEFLHAMAIHQFSMIILDRDLNWVWGHPEKYYSISPEPVFKDPNVFWPVTGWQVRPTIKMFPNQP